MGGNMRGLDSLSNLFGPDAEAPVIKNGASAEAARREDVSMISVEFNRTLDKALSEVDPTRPSHDEVRKRSRDFERARVERWIAEKIAAGRSSEVVTLTPILAEALLDRNTQNRPKARTHINTLVREVSDGRFTFNGESMSVTESGVLADGQHRCEMVMRSGLPVETVIVFGIKDEAIKTINLGLSRTAANVLAMEGAPDSNAVSTVANLIWQWKTHDRLANASNQRPTKTQVVDAFHHYEGIPESVEFCKMKRQSLIASRTVLAFCHWAIAERAGAELANRFIKMLVDGDKPVDGDPVSYCRDRLLGIKGWVFPQVRASLIFQTWNAWRRGEKVYRLNVNNKRLPRLER